MVCIYISYRCIIHIYTHIHSYVVPPQQSLIILSLRGAIYIYVWQYMFNKFTYIYIYIDIQVWEISISSVYYKIVLLFSRHSLFSRISIVFSSPRIVTSPIDSHSVTPRMLFVQAPNVAHHRKAQNNWTSTIPIEFGASAQTTSADWKQVARDPRIQDPWRSHLFNFFNSGKHLCFKNL